MSKELKKWMPMFWPEYLADTGHLNAAEHGAYLLLIGHYWMKGSVPWENEELVRRISKMSPRQWSLSRDVLRSFFEDDGRHKRCDEELAYAVEKSKRLSANAKHRHSNGKPVADTPTPTPTPTKKVEERKKDTGKMLLPDVWAISPVHYDLAKKLGLPVEEVGEAAAEMRAWSLGNGEKRRDWDMVFANWLRRNAAKKRKGNGFRGQGALQDDSRSLTRAADRLIEANKRGEFSFGPRPGLPAESGENVVQLLPKGRGE